jgi:ribonuclease R
VSKKKRETPAGRRHWRDDIVEALEHEGAPLDADELASKMNVSRQDRRAYTAALAELAQSGRVVRNRAGAILVARKIALIAGKISGHPDGFGFLEPDDGGADVYLPFVEMRKALHGDRATVRVNGQDARGRPRGEIVEVIAGADRRIVGRVHAKHGVMFLVPEDKRIAQEILLPPGESGGAKLGQVVSVQLVAQPSPHAQPVGRVVEVLGNHDDAGIEIEIALRKFELPYEFSRQALAAARVLPDAVREDDLKGRRDLREMPFVTIDGETAKDFDDAVHAVREGRGWRLWVAIADVSHYVRHGDALDVSARERGTSVYFPRRVIPMLPEKISNGLCSLNPDVDRLAMVCEMAIGPKGQVARYEFYPAAIRSSARLTYTEVWKRLESGKPPQNLAVLYEVFKALFAARQQRGAIDFDSSETQIHFDARGRIERIEATVRNDAHRLIEECMLAANVCAGAFLSERSHPVLYRVHDVPAEEKVSALREFLAELGLQLPGGRIPKPGDYAKLMAQIHARPDAPLLQTVMLRSMKQAVYSPDNAGHFGLAFEAYVHFTSPIRRYPDLLVHRSIRAALAGKRYEGLDWEEMGHHCSDTERRADEASRDVENWLKCDYMREKVGGTFSGRITGVAPFGVFVTLDDYFVDGLVHISELGRDYFRYEAVRHALVGERTGTQYRLADRLRVKLVRVDLESRKIDLVPANE